MFGSEIVFSSWECHGDAINIHLQNDEPISEKIIGIVDMMMRIMMKLMMMMMKLMMMMMKLMMMVSPAR